MTPPTPPPYLTGDAEAGHETYSGIVRDAEWRVVSNCAHAHKTHAAATRCGDRIARLLTRKGIS